MVTLTTEQSASKSAARSIDVQAFIDRQSLSRMHFAVLALCAVVMVVDGFDVFVVGKLAPAIAKDFGKPPASMTTVFALQQTGLALGGFLIGPLADRYGRKTMVAWCTAAFSLLTIACVGAGSILQLAILRGLAGIFLSGVIPNLIALLSEISPRGAKAKLVTLAFGGFTIGSALGSAVAAWLYIGYGWRIAFWIGGLFPLAVLPLIVFTLPESVQFLTRRDPSDPRIAHTLRKFVDTAELDGARGFHVAETTVAHRIRLTELFAAGRAKTTILIWLAFALQLGGIALLASWMPAFFLEFSRIPIERFALLSLYYSAGSLVGVMSVGFIIDRAGGRSVLPIYCVLTAVALTLLGIVPFGAPLFVLGLIAWGFFQSGCQSGLNAVAAATYPTEIRTTGVGAAFSAGRIGGIVMPLSGGAILAMRLSIELTFVLMALPSLGIALLLLWLKPGDENQSRATV
ncbi:aromatic acid/H+ symport family MFS transporter [soil metagenome]